MTSYRVLNKVASGGNATVFRARAESALGVTRLVALKKPHPHLLDDPEIADAFRREASISVRLRHPNVVQVFDVVEHEGSPSLVLELVDGMTLSELVRAQVRASDDARTVPAALRIVIDAARGLHALHEATGDDGAPLGLLHRDVSPQNVLLDRSGAVKISDFGLVKAMLGKDPATTEGILKGKVGYLAPEYVRGEPLDRRSDVFALGVVAWEALAKKRLFRAERETEVLEKIRTMAIPSLRDAIGDLATVFDPIVAKALARDVAARFATAKDLADALEHAAASERIAATSEAVAAVVARATTAGASVLPPQLASPSTRPPPNDTPTVTEVRAVSDAPSATWIAPTRDTEVVALEPAPPPPIPSTAPARAPRHLPRPAAVGLGLVLVGGAALVLAATRFFGGYARAPSAVPPATTDAGSPTDTSSASPSVALPPAGIVETAAPLPLPSSSAKVPKFPAPKLLPSATPAASSGPRPNPYVH